jgi:hypothetical protein
VDAGEGKFRMTLIHQRISLLGYRKLRNSQRAGRWSFVSNCVLSGKNEKV